MKRVLLIIGIVVSAGLIVGAGIYLSSRRPPTGAPAVSPPPGGLPTAGGINTGEGPTQTSGGTASSTGVSINKPAVDYTVLPNGEIRYIQPDGQIIRLTSTSSTILSAIKIPDLLDAKFSFDGRKVLVKSGDSASTRWSVYDVNKGTWRQLTLNAADASWSPRDYRIAYFARGVAATSLAILDLTLDSSRPRALLTLNGEGLAVVAWTGPGRLLFGEQASAYVPGDLWVYDLRTGALSLLREAIPGMNVVWGSGENGVLFAGRTSGRGGFLSLIDKNGTELQTFSFTTLSAKCTFWSVGTSTVENLICAVPQDIRSFASAALPDDYLKGALVTTDNFYAVNLQSGSLTAVPAAAALGADAERIRVIGNEVYFINRRDGKLYAASIGG